MNITRFCAGELQPERGEESVWNENLPSILEGHERGATGFCCPGRALRDGRADLFAAGRGKRESTQVLLLSRDCAGRLATQGEPAWHCRDDVSELSVSAAGRAGTELAGSDGAGLRGGGRAVFRRPSDSDPSRLQRLFDGTGHRGDLCPVSPFPDASRRE